MNNNIAKINAIMIRDVKNWEYIPIQISVIRYEDGEEKGTYESLIKPTQNITNSPDMPKHLNTTILDYAPPSYVVAKQIREFIKDCNIDIDKKIELSVRELLKCTL